MILSIEELAASNRRLIKINILLAGLVVLGPILAMALMVFKPDATYFASTADGRVIQLKPLSQPSVNADAVTGFVEESVRHVMSLDFVKYRETLAKGRGHFTKRGYKDFTDGLVSSGFLGKLKQEKLVTSANFVYGPVVTAEGVSPNSKLYTWVVKGRLLVNLEGANFVKPLNFDVQATVRRVSVDENVKGVQIDAIVFKESSVH